MKATLNFESETPSENYKFLIAVNDGPGPARTYDSGGTTVEVDIERLPVSIEIRQQFDGESS